MFEMRLMTCIGSTVVIATSGKAHEKPTYGPSHLGGKLKMKRQEMLCRQNLFFAHCGCYLTRRLVLVWARSVSKCDAVFPSFLVP
jgi:hypothetical protein